MPADTTHASEIFIQAQAAWNARTVPVYETFTLPCASTFLASSCRPGTQLRFVLRNSNGRDFVTTIPQHGEPVIILQRHGYIFGPAGAPFGFFRAVPQPGSALAPAPPNFTQDPLQTIATVTAVDRAYDIRLAGDETIDGRLCYHLVMHPLRDPERYRLRDLWVEHGSYQVVRLTYEQPFNTKTATVHYDFAPAGDSNIWTIVHIDAEAQNQRVSEDLQNIEFPEKVATSEEP